MSLALRGSGINELTGEELDQNLVPIVYMENLEKLEVTHRVFQNHIFLFPPKIFILKLIVWEFKNRKHSHGDEAEINKTED